MRSAGAAKIDDLKWQIQAREKIQTLLLRQYEYLQNHEGVFKTHPDRRFALLRMVQASFSLWRSAFLTDVKGKARDFEKHTAQFLERLLTHNAISFNDDFGSREFSVAYYNTNARYRIERMVKHDPDLAKIDIIKRVCALGEPDQQGKSVSQKVIWDMCHAALIECFNRFEGNPVEPIGRVRSP